MSELFEGLAEIFEVDVSEIRSETLLADYNWDSLAIVSTIALVDELFNVMLDGATLTKCKTVGDVEALVDAAK